MKVLKSGYLIYDRQRLIITGWTFDCEGKAIDLFEMLEAIFNYIKENPTVAFDANKFENKKVKEDDDGKI